MTDSKLADLTAITTPADDDLLYVVHDPAGTPVDRKVRVADLRGASATGLSPDDIPASPDAWDYEFEATSSSLPSGWSWVNQGTATYAEAKGAGLLTGTNDTGNLRAIVKSVPGGSSWEVTMKLGIAISPNNYQNAGVVMRDSATGKLETFWLLNTGAIDVDYWSSPTTGVSNQAIESGTRIYPRYWRVRKNSATSYDFAYSDDGIAFRQFASAINITTNVTPDQIGFGCSSNAGGVPSVACRWARKTA